MVMKVTLLIIVVILYILFIPVLWQAELRGTNNWFDKLLKISLLIAIGFAIYSTARYRIFNKDS